MRLVIWMLLLGMGMQTAAQKVLTEEEFTSIVLKYHPIAKGAEIEVRVAKADILANRGAFDPRFTNTRGRKEFSGITYYEYGISEIQIPTWYGIDLYAGTERIDGARINPEETVGSITYMGISLQPLQNLLIDKRRAALLQAKNFHLLSQVQRRIIINDLLKEALYSYWDWWEKHQVYKIVNTALQNSQNRFALVKGAYRGGDRPGIDTLEAYTQVQTFEIRLSEAYQNLRVAQLQLSAFLWTENNGQTQLPVDAIPQNYEQPKNLVLAEIINASTSHPELAQYDLKLKSLQIYKRLAFQSLLPELKINYNQTGYDFQKTLNGTWFDNNYRYGVSLSVPLRLSEGRGNFQRTKLQIQSTQLQLANKQVQVYTKLMQFFTDLQQTESQLQMQNQLLLNTNRLQRGEETKFANGESSLFLINSREQKTIEAEQKTIELKAKTQKAAVGLRWSAGIWVL